MACEGRENFCRMTFEDWLFYVVVYEKLFRGQNPSMAVPKLGADSFPSRHDDPSKDGDTGRLTQLSVRSQSLLHILTSITRSQFHGAAEHKICSAQKYLA